MPRRLSLLSIALAATVTIGLSHAAAFAAPDTPASRLERVERQGRIVSRHQVSTRTLAFRISHRSGFGAWAWPTGKIEITPALVDVLDDDELAAALAHEAAHLGTDAPRLASRASLAPSDNEAIERAADRAGCAMLAEAGIPPQAMVRMLKKVATGLREPRMLAARIEAARSVCLSSN